jgi:hypothetical protein
MDVIAYDINNNYEAVELGSVAGGLFVDKLKRRQKRDLQIVKPINAVYPAIVDRIQTEDTFGFIATQSFSALGDAAINWLQWPDDVPRLAHLSFTQGGEILWIPGAGIDTVEQAEKKGCLVSWSYTVIGGGAVTAKKPF